MAEPPSVGETINRLLADRKSTSDSVPTSEQIVERLSRRFGNGGNARIRQALYRRLAHLVTVHGHPVYVEICSIASSATSCRHPDRYFCAAVVRRLREAGYMEGGSNEL